MKTLLDLLNIYKELDGKDKFTALDYEKHKDLNNHTYFKNEELGYTISFNDIEKYILIKKNEEEVKVNYSEILAIVDMCKELGYEEYYIGE